MGRALAGFCVGWHGVRVALWRLGRPITEPRRAAIAGAVAGSSLAMLQPEIAGVNTEVQASASLAALRIVRAWGRTSRGLGEDVCAASGRRRTVVRWLLLSLAPVCIACWRLLTQHCQGGEATALHPGSTRWLSSLAPASSPQPVAGGFAAIAAHLGRAWRHGAAAQLRMATPGYLITAGCDGRLGSRGRRAQQALALARDTIAAGGVSATFAGFLLAGPEACARGGWCAGLSLFLLRPSRRQEYAAAISYRAALSVALEVAARSTPSGRSSEGAVRVLGAVLLGSAAATILCEYARVAGGASSSGLAPAAAIQEREARAAHFLLGFDEAEEEGDGVEGKERHGEGGKREEGSRSQDKTD
jgi:hypothetical protein